MDPPRRRGIVTVIFVIFALFAPWIAPYDFNQTRTPPA